MLIIIIIIIKIIIMIIIIIITITINTIHRMTRKCYSAIIHNRLKYHSHSNSTALMEKKHSFFTSIQRELPGNFAVVSLSGIDKKLIYWSPVIKPTHQSSLWRDSGGRVK